MTPDSSHATIAVAIVHATGRCAAWNKFARATAATTAPMTRKTEPMLNLTW
jgi:hypothetical protein